MAAQLGVSKITVEQAYLQLATEGYIQAHNKAPYEVLEIVQPLGGDCDTMMQNYPTWNMSCEGSLSPVKSPILYNFATGAMDPEGFDFKRWKRFIGYALRDTKRSYDLWSIRRGTRTAECVESIFAAGTRCKSYSRSYSCD